MSEDTVSKKDMHRFMLSSAMKMQDQAEEYTKELVALEAENTQLREALKLTFSFCPKGPVPEGLAPQFYHTLDYRSEVELQARIDQVGELIHRQRTSND